MSARPGTRQRPRAYTGDQVAEIAIFDATERLLAKQPLHELSVEQIVKEAGLSRASFYHYFSSKFEVAVALLDRVFNEMYSETHEALESPWDGSGEALRSSLGQGLETWAAHQGVIHATLENVHADPALAEMWDAVVAPFIAVVTDQIDRERAAGRAPEGLPAKTIATALVTAATRIFYVGTMGIDRRMKTKEQRLDAIVAISMAAIYGGSGPRGATS
jgi:AcrR family transcriptional regulator